MADSALLDTMRRAPPTGASGAIRRLPGVPGLGLAAAIVGSSAYLLILQSHFTFFADDWMVIIDRRGTSVGDFLDPHNDHIALAPVAIYKGLPELFGMTSALPFQIGFSGSVAAGIGALLALDRDSRWGDMTACILLVASTCFSELGIPFAVGALVNVALGPWPRLQLLYVPLVPAFLYGLWYLGCGGIPDPRGRAFTTSSTRPSSSSNRSRRISPLCWGSPPCSAPSEGENLAGSAEGKWCWSSQSR